MTQKPKTSLKKTNIPWIGEIPENWKVQRLKSVILRSKNGAWGDDPKGDKNDIVCIRVADFDKENYGISDLNLTYRNIPDSDDILLEEWDLLLEKSGGGDLQLVGRVVNFNQTFSAVTSNFLATIKVNKNIIDNKFLYYLLRYYYSINVNYRSIKQTTGIQNLDSDSYFQEPIAFPENKDSQISIATFLDQKTTEIKKFIENKRRLIELLKEQKQSIIHRAVTKGIDPDAKMKDSGIPWIGEIPEDWEVRKIKHIFSGINNGTTASQIEGKSDFPVTRIETISTGEINLDKVGFIDEKDVNESYRLRKNDFLLSHINSFEYVGNLACYENDSVQLYHGMNLLKMSPKDILFPKFAKYLLKSFYFKFYIQTICKPAINQVSVPTGAIKDMVVFLPSITIQEIIVQYIEKETTQIDSAISKIEQEITLIEEYQTSLIYQAVTGKIQI